MVARKILGSLSVVESSDSTEMLELAKEAFDEVAQKAHGSHRLSLRRTKSVDTSCARQRQNQIPTGSTVRFQTTLGCLNDRSDSAKQLGKTRISSESSPHALTHRMMRSWHHSGPEPEFRQKFRGENQWYRWLVSNQRPPDPQSGALTN